MSATSLRAGVWVLLATVSIALALLVVCAAMALGAEPASTPVVVLDSGDARSEGGGPGLVGSPLLVLGGVIALGIVTAVVTVLLARLSRRG